MFCTHHKSVGNDPYRGSEGRGDEQRGLYPTSVDGRSLFESKKILETKGIVRLSSSFVPVYTGIRNSGDYKRH